MQLKPQVMLICPENVIPTFLEEAVEKEIEKSKLLRPIAKVEWMPNGTDVAILISCGNDRSIWHEIRAAAEKALGAAHKKLKIKFEDAPGMWLE